MQEKLMLLVYYFIILLKLNHFYTLKYINICVLKMPAANTTSCDGHMMFRIWCARAL